MKWLIIFKVYSLKKIKEDKVLFLFTAISILIATSISLIIPVINIENEKFIESNIEKINDGDLSIVLKGEQPSSFYEKLEEAKNAGDRVRKSTIANCYYKKDSNNLMGTISIGEYSIENDEIILQRRMADSLNVDIGDYVELDTSGNGVYKYKVVGIENLATGVTNDSKLLGYGKVNVKDELRSIDGVEIVSIDTNNPIKLKESLSKINNLNEYKTIEDIRLEAKDEIFIQRLVLSILSSVGYIFSIITIISTTIVIILKRKKDIAILRLLSFDLKEIKKAFIAELSLWVCIPIVLSGMISSSLIKVILSLSSIVIDSVSRESIGIIINGMMFNALLFFLIINIAMILISGIRPMAVIREDYNEIKMGSKKAFVVIILIISILLSLYSIFCGEIENIGGIAIVIGSILMFLGIIMIVIKLLAKINFRNYEIMYSIKSIKNRVFSYILVILSLTMTLWVMLIGFNLEEAIKISYKESLENALPYNYYIENKDINNTERVLKSNNEIEGFIKYLAIEGTIKNEGFNDSSRTVEINEVNKDDYGIKFKLVEGENLFEGENGILISDDLRSRNKINLNDILEIETKEGIIKERVKGIYKSGGINTGSILKEDVKFGEEISYLVNSSSGSFIEELTNTSVIAISSLGDKMGVYISSFLKVFRIISIICFLGTILFNINIVYINCNRDEKDEEILMAIGLGKIFILKTQIIKMIITIILSSILSLGIYGLIVKLFFALMFKGNGSISLSIIIMNIVLAIIVSIISFGYSFKKIMKKKELRLLRED